MPSDQLNLLYSYIDQCSISVEQLEKVGHYFSYEFISQFSGYNRYKRSVSCKQGKPPELIRYALNVAILHAGATKASALLSPNKKIKNNINPADLYSTAALFRSQLEKLKVVSVLDGDELTFFANTLPTEAQQEKFLADNGINVIKKPIDDISAIARIFVSFTSPQLEKKHLFDQAISYEGESVLSEAAYKQLNSFENIFKEAKNKEDIHPAEQYRNIKLDEYLTPLNVEFHKWSIALKNELETILDQLAHPVEAFNNKLQSIGNKIVNDDERSKLCNEVKLFINDQQKVFRHAESTLKDFNSIVTDDCDIPLIEWEIWSSRLSQHIYLANDAFLMLSEESEEINSILNEFEEGIEDSTQANNIESESESVSAHSVEATHALEEDESVNTTDTLEASTSEEESASSQPDVPSNTEAPQQEDQDRIIDDKKDDEHAALLALVKDMIQKNQYEGRQAESDQRDFRHMKNADIKKLKAEWRQTRHMSNSLPTDEEVMTADAITPEVDSVEAKAPLNQVAIETSALNDAATNVSNEHQKISRQSSSISSGATSHPEGHDQTHYAQPVSPMSSEVQCVTEQAVENTDDHRVLDNNTSRHRRRKHRRSDENGDNHHRRSHHSDRISPVVADTSAILAPQSSSGQGLLTRLRSHFSDALDTARKEARLKAERRRNQETKAEFVLPLMIQIRKIMILLTMLIQNSFN